jgi:hypothetical protein
MAFGSWTPQAARENSFPALWNPTASFDHDFVDASEGHWSVTARIVPANHSGSISIIILREIDYTYRTCYVRT